MFTSTDITSKKFDKAAFGYRAEDVESFLGEVSRDYTMLQKNNQELERKLEVLAEKLEEYRTDEDSLRSALLGAQKLGDSVIRESKQKAEIIMRDANVKADRVIENAQREIENERLTLSRMQKEVALFKTRLLSIYKQHIELISALPSDNDDERRHAEEPKAQEQIPEEPQELHAAVSEDVESENDLERIGMDSVVSEDDKHEYSSDGKPSDPINYFERRERSAATAASARSTESRFGPLKFGVGYDLNRDEQTKKKR